MNRKKVLALLAVTVTFSTVMTACGFGGGDDDQMVVETTPVPEPTKAPKATPTPVPADAQSNTYRSADKSVAITLPDATWANKADESDMLSFESPEQGKLLILHGKGDEDMSVAVPPRTPDVAVSLERASDLEQGTDFVIHDFTSSETNGINVYSYTTEYLTDKSGYAYVVNKYFENEDEFYSITGSVKKKDEKLLKKVKKSVNSFTIKGDSSLKSGLRRANPTRRRKKLRQLIMQAQIIPESRPRVRRAQAAFPQRNTAEMQSAIPTRQEPSTATLTVLPLSSTTTATATGLTRTAIPITS